MRAETFLLAASMLSFGLAFPAVAEEPTTTSLEAPSASRGSAGLEALVEEALPAELRRTADIRWADERSVLLPVGRRGVFRYPLHGTDRQPTREMTDGNGEAQVFASELLAVSDEHLVAAAPLFVFGWKGREAPDTEQVSAFFESFEDLDAFRNRVAVLGLIRGEDREIAPEGAIVWEGMLTDEGPRLEPMHFSISGPGARLTERCMMTRAGGVRYLPDGRLVVVPGAEPGAYLYSSEGALLDTWDTAALAVGPDCDLDMETTMTLAADLSARAHYLNRFRTVDEILVLDGTPHLVVRWAETEGTRWELIALEPRGKTSRRPLPVESPSRFAHIRGDVKNGRVVLLVFDESMFFPKGDPARKTAEPTRIVVLESAAKAEAAGAKAAARAVAQ